MRLTLRYSLQHQGLEDLYEVVDADTDEILSEPFPWDQAMLAKYILQKNQSTTPNPPVQH